MKLRLGAAFSLGVSATVSASPPNWVATAHNDHGAYYLDTNNIRADGANRIAWVKGPGLAEANLVHINVQYRFYCREQQLEMLYAVGYKEDETIGTSQVVNGMRMPVVPGSAYDSILSAVCAFKGN